MHAASPAVSLFQNIISSSLLSKNSGNESFSGMNWMRDFSYSNRRENDFERYYLTENQKNVYVVEENRGIFCTENTERANI